MKTLRLFGMLLLAISLCLSACSEIENPIEPTPDPKPEEVKSEITIDADIITNGLSFTSDKGEKSISFTTNEDWTLSIAATPSDDTWCTASTTSGAKGNANVKFTVTENTSYDDRSVSVTIKSGTASKTFTITQKYADALLLTTNKYELSQEGGTIEIEVKANIDYGMEIAESAKDWITETSTRALTAYKHTFEISLNEDSEKREGEIHFKSGDKVETVKVYQAGGALILLSKNEYNVSANGETISIDISSNIEYSVQMPDADWITEVVTRGMSSHSLQYNISPNEGYDSRSAEIIFYDKNSDLKEILKVTQAQKDAIVISEKNIKVASKGGVLEIKINTNVDLEVQIPTEYSWITLTETRSLDEKYVYLAVEENISEEERRATITITDKDNRLSEDIVITQQANIPTVKLEEAGTMKQLLGDSYLRIATLKIIGPINGDDVYVLRQMIGTNQFSYASRGKLTSLDLSEAHIVEGGGYYYNKFSTSNDIIGERMFSNCKNLKEIVLPNNITTIGDLAFEYCDGLTSVILPNTVRSIDYGAFYGCKSLTNINIPNSVTNIEHSAFYDCKMLKSVELPNGISLIPSSLFWGCSSLTEIDIPDSIISIEGYAFYGCSNLKEFRGKYASEDGKCLIIDGVLLAFAPGGITSYSIPDNVTTINNSLFCYSNNLVEITIPNSVKSIGDGAFSNCKRLERVYCKAVVPPTGGYWMFDDIAYNSKIYVPYESVKEYKDSKGWNTYADMIIGYDYENNEIFVDVKKCKVGDIVTIGGVTGIVFLADGDVVKLISVTETKCEWGLYGQLIGTYDQENGLVNVEEAKDDGCFDSLPAFVWCEKLGKGWYLPATKELAPACQIEGYLNNLLSENGYAYLNGEYWTSTEDGGDYAKAVVFDICGSEHGISCSKNGRNKVRAVRTFTLNDN